MLIAQSLDPTTFPPLSRLPANLAGADGFQFGSFDAWANGVIRVVHVDAQPAELS
jgi:hypothetical protein